MMIAKELDKIKSTHLLKRKSVESLKVIAARQQTNMTAIISELIEDFIEKHKDLL